MATHNDKSAKRFLSREEILAARDLPFEVMDVPEWGGEICVRGMTAGERERFQALYAQFTGKSAAEIAGETHLAARFCAVLICDDAGKRIFGDEDIEALLEKNGELLERVAAVGMRLSGITQQMTDDLKNAQSGGSSSG